MCVYICVCTYVCIHMCVYTHTHSQRDISIHQLFHFYNELKLKAEVLCLLKLSQLRLFIIILHTNNKEIKEVIIYLVI